MPDIKQGKNTTRYPKTAAKVPDDFFIDDDALDEEWAAIIRSRALAKKSISLQVQIKDSTGK